jgi:dolichol-phosphate mannosyltransferase
MNGDKGVKQAVKDAVSRLPGGSWLVKQRFAKFGAVGFVGTLVNLAVVYVGQEFLYRGIVLAPLRLNLSLATAIFIATLHNFIWNRAWTWGDRKTDIRKPIAVQFMQYCTACWLAIALQIFFTNVFTQYMHYLPANVLAIGMTAILNYLLNHIWTFRARK